MAYTQADLDALQAAMAKGARRVKMNGEEVEFRSIDVMERTERRIKKALGQISSKRLVQVTTVNGWR